MPSPFPGMDPYLEGPTMWPDFHGAMLPAFRRQLAAQAPDPYYVKLHERRYTWTPSRTGRSDVGQDLSIAEAGSGSRGSAVAVARATPGVELLQVAMPVEAREVSLRIRDRGSDDLVTVVELISPNNKTARHPGQLVYLRRRGGVLGRDANLVEVDLLRGGQRMPMQDPWPATHYTVMVSRMDRRPDCEVYGVRLQRRLPVVAIPLRPGQPDLQLDLQAAMNECYDDAGYGRMVRYCGPPTVPLPIEDQEWAERVCGRCEETREPTGDLARV